MRLRSRPRIGHETCFLLFLFLLLMKMDVAFAAESEPMLSQYGHTVWHLENELANAAPNAIVQSSDGYVWIGTETGLLRFDGVQFVPWTPPNWEKIADHQVYVLYAGKDGTVWIGTPTNLASWSHGVLTVIDTGLPVYVNQIAEAADHSVWFTNSRRADRKALCHVVQAKAKCFGLSDGLPAGGAQTLIANADGSLSIGTDEFIAEWSPERGLISKQIANSYNSKTQIAQITVIERQADGSKLVGFAAPGPGRGLQHLSGSKWQPVKAPDFDGSSLEVQAILTDRLGALWIGTRSSGLFRILGNSVEQYDKRAGLSGNSVRDIREDREGNLWVATDGGIDSFHALKTTTWSSDQGLLAGHVHSILATHDDAVLLAIDHSLNQIRDGKVSTLELPGVKSLSFIYSVLEDTMGRYWIGIDKDLYIYDGHKVSVVTKPTGEHLGAVFSMSLAQDGSVWAMTYPGSQPRELLHFRDDKIVDSTRARAFGLKVVADQGNGAWVNGQGQIAHYADGKIHWFPLTAGPDPKNFSTQDDLAVSKDGTIYSSSRLGLWALKNNEARRIDVSAGLPCNDVNGVFVSRESSLWMRTTCGLIEIQVQAIDKWWHHSLNAIPYRLISPFDGARPSRTTFFPQIYQAPDGRIWVGYDSVVQAIDPNHISANSQLPPVHIEEVIADHKKIPAMGGLKLPPLMHDLELRYTALSLTAPQNVRFKYMLEGRDSGWQDPGTRRTAFYEDLRPRHYRFRVIAANNDGLWNNVGDSLEFDVQAAWFQTLWFRISVLTSIGIFFWLLYRWRVTSLAKEINARFNERLDERTRLAREIHDTLLQTLQGSKIVADSALAPSADEAWMRAALQKVSAWLDQAISEGRSAVHALRASTVAHDEIADHLDRTLREQCDGLPLVAELKVIGEPRVLHPIVRDELSLIAREAIRNVCLHAKATELNLELQFVDDLRVSIKDNGIGIVPEIVVSGKDGHFGLQSMKERSSRIHASIDFRQNQPSGTEVTLRIPGAVAYKQDSQTQHFSIRRFLGF